MHNPLIYLALCWIIFCVLHSALISLPVATWLQRLRPGWERYERLIYNGIAVITLIPPAYFGLTIIGAPIFVWSGWLRWVQAVLVLWALLFFWGGTRQFDTSRFLGLRQLQGKKGTHQAQGNEPLVMDGVLKIVRHPWYSGGIAIIWARDATVAVLVTNVILTLYFIVGAILEERRLVQEFGAVYQRYQREVPMLFPWRWVLQRVKRS